jgi:hypothetical protein
MAGAIEHAKLLYNQEMIDAAIVFIQNQVGIWPPKFARIVRACRK